MMEKTDKKFSRSVVTSHNIFHRLL